MRLDKHRLACYWATAIALQSAVALLAITFPTAFGYGGKMLVDDDVRIYFRYARPILEGSWPYRDYAVEYPILAIPFFVAPLIFGGSFAAYKYGFAAEMLAINAIAAWLVARQVEESKGIDKVPFRLAWYSLAFVALCPMIVCRFDLVPMLLAFAAARWLSTGKSKRGALACGLGVLVKLVPGLVFVPMIAARGPWKPKVSASIILIATIGLGGMGWWLLGGSRVLQSFRYHGERGLEIGSIYASGYLIAHKLAGVVIFSHFDHGSMNLSGPGSGDAAHLSTILQGAMLLLVASRARLADPGQEMRHALAALLAYIVPGKVLSPQYLIWLIPFVAALEGRSGDCSRRIYLVACVLTTALYPHLFHALSYFETGAVIALASRNLALAWLFATLIRRRSDFCWRDLKAS